MSIAGAVPIGSFINPLSWLKSPKDLSADGWWDFSYAGTVGVVGGTFQDAAGNTPCVNASTMMRCDDRSGNDFHVTNTTGLQTWEDFSQNGLGAGEFLSNGGNTGLSVDGDGPLTTATTEWSLFVLALLDPVQISSYSNCAIAATDRNAIRDQWALTPQSAGTKYYHLRVVASGAIVATDKVAVNIIDRYFWLYVDLDTSNSNFYIDNVLNATGTPGLFTPTPAGDVLIGTGTKINGTPTAALAPWNGKILEAGVFDRKLSTVERTNLWNYHKNRYDLISP